MDTTAAGPKVQRRETFRLRRFFSLHGPGLITGASDDDPSGIGTYSQAGAQLGFGVGWTMLLTYPLIAIIITTAATLHTQGNTAIESSAQAAEALKPIAGPLAELVFAVGTIGTGLLAIPVLAGATAYAIGEGLRWKVGLSRKPKEAVAFYAVLGLSGLCGISLNFTAIDPRRCTGAPSSTAYLWRL